MGKRNESLNRLQGAKRTVRFIGICRCVGIRQIDGAPEVIFISPCECQGFHGKNRWIVKTDFTPVPLDKSAIPSEITRCTSPALSTTRISPRPNFARAFA
jgi:hypothetical protein